MIRGLVRGAREAVIPLSVRGPGGDCVVDGIIDTGFEGALTLPGEVIAALELSWWKVGGAVLADGTATIIDMYRGMVMWDGSWKRISVIRAETSPLIGMSLLKGFELRMKVHDNGRVLIKALP